MVAAACQSDQPATLLVAWPFFRRGLTVHCLRPRPHGLVAACRSTTRTAHYILAADRDRIGLRILHGRVSNRVPLGAMGRENTHQRALYSASDSGIPQCKIDPRRPSSFCGLRIAPTCRTESRSAPWRRKSDPASNASVLSGGGAPDGTTFGFVHASPLRGPSRGHGGHCPPLGFLPRNPDAARHVAADGERYPHPEQQLFWY